MHNYQRVLLTYAPAGGIVKAMLQQLDDYAEYWLDIRELPVSPDGKILLSQESRDVQESEVSHAPSQGEKPQNDQ